MTAYYHRRLTAYYYSSGRRTSDHLCCSAGVFHCSVGVLLLFRGIAEVHSSCEEFVFSVRFFFFLLSPEFWQIYPRAPSIAAEIITVAAFSESFSAKRSRTAPGPPTCAGKDS